MATILVIKQLLVKNFDVTCNAQGLSYSNFLPKNGYSIKKSYENNNPTDPSQWCIHWLVWAYCYYEKVYTDDTVIYLYGLE